MNTFSEQKIQTALQSQEIGSHLHLYDEVDSTNTLAKKLACEGACSGTLIVADTQTSGKGRKGNTWFSPKGVGMYLSIILRPDSQGENPFFFTIISGIATALAIRKTTGLHASIKWPNDILIDGEKIAGILTEASHSNGKTTFVVIGIGVNVNTAIDQIPSEIKHKATSIKIVSGKNQVRDDLLIHICHELERWYIKYKKGELHAIREQWTKTSHMIGKYVTIDTGSEHITGTALTINTNGFLMLQTSTGQIKEITCGETCYE